MSCKCALYAANTTDQEVDAGGVINLGNIVRKFGQNADMSGGNLVVNGNGYYDIDLNVTFTGSATDTETIAIYKDGVAIPGASAEITTAASTIYQVSIPALIRETCCCESVITAVSSLALTINNASIVVEKV